MEYTNYTNKPCRILIYDSSKYENHIGMLKFKSLAHAYRALQGDTNFTRIYKKGLAPMYWDKVTSLSSFRKYCRNHKFFRGCYLTDVFGNEKSLYFFSLMQA